MSGYFSNFSLNRITDTIATAAHKTQDTLTNAIANVNLNDPQTKLSIKARTRYLQESLGTVGEISKLPPQYESLEKKTDALEKCCKRMLLVTKTFEMDGYDYPPNISESISDWWSMGKDGWFGGSSKKSAKDSSDSNDNKASEPFMPRSFAQAIAKAAHDSGVFLSNVQSIETSKSPEGKDDISPPIGEELDDDFDDVNDLKKIFETLSKCYKNIDEGKFEMDTSITKEFNNKLEKLINEDFKKVHELRRKVDDSRLKFDTVLYEIRLKEKKSKDSQQILQEAEKTNVLSKDAVPSTAAPKVEMEGNSADVEKKGDVDSKDQNVSENDTEANVQNKDSDEHPTPISEEDKLLEQLEDEFVSNTSAAVEVMGEITDRSELLTLMKLFQTCQLVYFRQCVQELESSVKVLNSLEDEHN